MELNQRNELNARSASIFFGCFSSSLLMVSEAVLEEFGYPVSTAFARRVRRGAGTVPGFESQCSELPRYQRVKTDLRPAVEEAVAPGSNQTFVHSCTWELPSGVTLSAEATEKCAAGGAPRRR